LSGGQVCRVLIEMKSKHAWIRVQDPIESVKRYTHMRGIIGLGTSKIEKAMGSFETIHLLSLTQMIRKPLEFKLGRGWYSHAAELDFQARQAARRAITESPAKVLTVR